MDAQNKYTLGLNSCQAFVLVIYRNSKDFLDFVTIGFACLNTWSFSVIHIFRKTNNKFFYLIFFNELA